MTTRFRIRLASFAVASTCLFALAGTASAFELLDQLLGKGGSAYGCNAPECFSGSSKGRGKMASSCGCCAHTPVLDRVADMTRSLKCRLTSIELPQLSMPCIDLSNLFPCNRCCCECGGGGKSGSGKAMAVVPLESPAPVEPPAPVYAPTVPIFDS